jgi:hypothetical protein
MASENYVKMLEIPINSSEVIEKPSKRRKKDVKKRVIEKVNETASKETVTTSVVNAGSKQKVKKLRTERPKFKLFKAKEKQIKSKVKQAPKTSTVKNVGFDIVSVQVVAIFVLIVAIILTNIFIENSGINNLMRSVFNKTDGVSSLEYSAFSASSPSKSSQVTIDGGVMTVSSGSVYSPCDGVVESVSESDGKYTITVCHSYSFLTVVSGLESVYVSSGEKVYQNIPVGYSSGESLVTMYSSDVVLTGFILSDNQIVWVS